MAGWELVSAEPLTMHRTNRLANMYVLSPYVWRDGDAFHIFVRAVPRRDDEPRLKMAEIWHGVSTDGHHFDMDVAPTIFPGPDLVDLDGCEDPTVHVEGGTVRVWYTGYNQQQQTGRLLLARGPDCSRIAKAGLAIDSTPDFTNPKEAAIAAISDCRWRMYFEYVHKDASLIGQAETDDLDGIWRDIAASPIVPRADSWDCWHLSPGPIVGEGKRRPTMFYNGATRDAKWRIGWATFDRHLTQLTDRCEEPLIAPDKPLTGGATDIAFVASAIEHDDAVLLYYSQSDRDLRVATVRRTK
ncbi:hypothetical protein [Novosphingopyxis sp.]|uniref:glycoside hydrolase family 130 protein n=1 Tax=Novosphingopyxis sp. TaxID=2709690 RepID=UPI003B5AE3D1